MASNSDTHQASNLDVRSHRKRGGGEGEESFLWAVSYSDLLMVLLSFFIVFFDPSAEEAQNRLKIVAKSVDQVSGMEKAKATASSGESKSDLASKSSGVKAVQDGLLGAQIAYQVSTKNPGVVQIDFPDNFYGAGQYDLSRHRREALFRVIRAIHSTKAAVKVTFIGHSDQQPLHRLLQLNVLKTNHDLSGLRASRALDLARELGMDSKRLFFEGAGSALRDTRSLSIRITEVDKP